MNQLQALNQAKSIQIKGVGPLAYTSVSSQIIGGQLWWAFKLKDDIIAVCRPANRQGSKRWLASAGRYEAEGKSYPAYVLNIDTVYKGAKPLCTSRCPVGLSLFYEIEHARRTYDLEDVPLKIGGRTIHALNVRETGATRYEITDKNGQAVAWGRHAALGMAWKQFGGQLKAVVDRDMMGMLKQTALPTLKGGRKVTLPLIPRLASIAVWGELADSGQSGPECIDVLSDGKLLVQKVGASPLTFEIGPDSGAKMWTRPQMPDGGLTPVFPVKLKTVPPKEKDGEPTFVMVLVPTAMPLTSALMMK